MENKLDKKAVGFSLSYAITSIFTALLVILKESFGPLKDAMKALTGHHWATHGLVTILLFFILGYVFSKESYREKFDAKKLSSMIVWFTIAAIIIISGYMLVHYLSK